jgi:lipoate-protein ligase A
MLLLHSPPLEGAQNMALDEALMDRARRTGEAVFRVYSWSKATLSLGRHQVARGVFDPARLESQGTDIVRRLSGGRAVLHDREVTYSVAAPLAQGELLRGHYSTINNILVRALQSLGVRAELALRTGRQPVPASAPCFELPSEGEIVVAGRKLVGSALVRSNGAWLQHGSILVHDNQALVARLAAVPVGSTAPAATLRQALSREPSVLEVAEALFESVRASVTGPATELELDDATIACRDRAMEKYLSAEWTWRC